MENDRSIPTGKMYPIDLAPQKITIMKSVPNSEVKMTHLMSSQPKTTVSSQLPPHASSASGMMRSSLAQIISPNSSSQMIVSGSPILQGSQIVSQGTQLHSQGTQILPSSQLITPNGQILSPGTQIISQGTQLSAQVATSNTSSVQTSSPISGTVLNVANQMASGASNLVVNPTVRTLPPTVRVLPPLPHHNTRPAVQLSTVNVSTASNVVVNKGVSVGVTSHVPRGIAAGASLAMRPVAPTAQPQPAANQGAWGLARAPRSALVYAPRARASLSLSTASTLSTTSVLNTASSVVSGAGRGVTPRGPAPGQAPGAAPGLGPVSASGPAPASAAQRPLPLLQRNYQPAKVVGVGAGGARGVGNSAPAQLYYEVPRAPAPYAHAHAHLAPQVNVINATGPALQENRQSASIQTVSVLPRPTILRKRDIEGSPTKPLSGSVNYPVEGTGWEDVAATGSGGSTTMSASSSPPHDLEPDTEPRDLDLEPRKKPRKQLLTNEVRQCEYPPEDVPSSPPTINVNPPPKRPQLSSTYVCGWRSTALHFVRPADVRRRECKPRDIVAIAAQKHVLSSADGWKVHHLTAQMDDLMSLESDVGSQLAGLLRTLETAPVKAFNALQPQSHTLLELLKGNIQRSKIVCEGIQEAREDILRVFTHRKSVSDILTRQADKRCFRKHRSQS